MKDWRNISYLLDGDDTQRHVYEVLKTSMVMRLLFAFDATLAGTYPIGIYLPSSDIDIICTYTRKEHFESVVMNTFDKHEEFRIHTKYIRNEESVIARFRLMGFVVEIFGQSVPVEEQFAYRHMLIEDQLLSERDEDFRLEVIRQKEKGLSTEEAFCSLLGIEGDPYIELLKS